MAVAVALGSPVTADPAAGLDSTRDSIIVYASLTLSGNYGGASSHGDTVDLSSLGISSDYIPKWGEIREDQQAGNAPLGYNFIFARGTTQKNGVLSITGGAAGSGQGGTEITEASAYSSFTPSLNGAVLRGKFEFVKNI